MVVMMMAVMILSPHLAQPLLERASGSWWGRSPSLRGRARWRNPTRSASGHSSSPSECPPSLTGELRPRRGGGWRLELEVTPAASDSKAHVLPTVLHHIWNLLFPGAPGGATGLT